MYANRTICVRLHYLKTFNCIPIELIVLDSNRRNHLTVFKQMKSDSFKNNFSCKIFAYNSYIKRVLSFDEAKITSLRRNEFIMTL